MIHDSARRRSEFSNTESASRVQHEKVEEGSRNSLQGGAAGNKGLPPSDVHLYAVSFSKYFNVS